MREYEIKGLSDEEIILIVKSLQVTNLESDDDEELNLISEILGKIRKAIEAD